MHWYLLLLNVAKRGSASASNSKSDTNVALLYNEKPPRILPLDAIYILLSVANANTSISTCTCIFTARRYAQRGIDATAIPSVRLSVRLSVRHTGGSVKNG